jgi:hypothetical protein
MPGVISSPREAGASLSRAPPGATILPVGWLVAGAASGSKAPQIPSLWWVPLIAAVATAVGTVLACVAWSGLHGSWKGGLVLATSAWDSSDSWVTNLAAVGSALTALITSSSISTFITGVRTAWFAVVSLMLGGSAVMAPVVFGLFAKTPSTVSHTPVGTRTGLVLASVVSLTAAFGLMAVIGQVMSYSIESATQKSFTYGGLAVAGLLMALYSVRSFAALVAAPHQARDARAGGSPRMSGTL